MASLRFHVGYKQERIKQKKMNNKETVQTGGKGAGSRAAKTHIIEQKLK